MTTENTDLVIVGGGIAGLVAANRALDLGLRAHVLEAQLEAKYPCATRMSGGVFHVIFRSVATPPDELYKAIVEGTEGYADLTLARAIADNAARAADWLRAHGIIFGRLDSDSGWDDNILAPLGYQSNTSLVWEDLGSDVFMHAMEARLTTRGGRLIRGARASELVVEDGRCVGVRAQRTDGSTSTHAAKSVVLADGSFHGNHDLLRRYVTAHPELLLFRGPAPGLGDGIAMGQSLGASVAGMEYFYGHLLSADALHNPALVLFPFIDFLAAGGMFVDHTGLRFADEGRDGRYMTNMLAQTATGIGYAVFDERIWNAQGRHFHSPPNPSLIEKGATLHRANDLATLAQLAGLPPDQPVRSVSEYNAALYAGHLDLLTPPRTTKHLPASPIATPPFYAAPACAAITHAFGGLTIDAHARVVREDGRPIPGLFAAGAVCGGIDGGPGAAYVGGLIIGAVFGMLAAETCANA